MGVAAHELFHVWQHENNKNKSDIKWVEGSANVAMYLVLNKLDTDLARYHLDSMMEYKDPVYGDGFRTALEYYKKNGINKFLLKH